MLTSDMRYCPRCATELIESLQFGRPRPTCSQCQWIYFADPRVAVAGLLLHEGQVLLVQRINDPFRGKWSLPAGFVDAGEDPRDALQRECMEETGLKVDVTDLLDIVSGAEHPRGADILIVYRVESKSGSIRPGDDAEQVGFFDIDQLPPLAFNSTPKILNQFAIKF